MLGYDFCIDHTWGSLNLLNPNACVRDHDVFRYFACSVFSLLTLPFVRGEPFGGARQAPEAAVRFLPSTPVFFL